MLETTSTSQSTPKPNGNGKPKEPTLAELMAEMAKLKAANDALAAKLAKAEEPRKITAKVSLKGALSVYGLGQFPVTLYQEQWNRLFAAKDDILEYMEVHKSELKKKGDELSEETKALIAQRDAEFKARTA